MYYRIAIAGQHSSIKAPGSLPKKYSVIAIYYRIAFGGQYCPIGAKSL
jgi:hypothetical protein